MVVACVCWVFMNTNIATRARTAIIVKETEKKKYLDFIAISSPYPTQGRLWVYKYDACFLCKVPLYTREWIRSMADMAHARIAVGLPVTQQPPHRSRRAVFPHRALQKYSLPQSSLDQLKLSPLGRPTIRGRSIL